MNGAPARLLYLNFIGFVSVAVVARKSDVVLIATSAIRDRNDVVKLYFIVLQMFVTMLAGIVIATHNAHL
jgi:hypothetical protein